MSMICELFVVSPRQAADVLNDPMTVHELLDSLDQSKAVLSLEKSWHGLHFAFAGTPSEGGIPAGFLIGGGTLVGEEDVGYGPARVLTADEVRCVNDFLSRFTDSEFQSRLDPVQLAAEGIYPMIWDEPLHELREEYAGYLEQLRNHVHRAAAAGQALLIALR